MELKGVLKRNEDFICRLVDGEAVLMSPLGDGLHIFNEVGTRIWELVDGNNTIEDIVNQIYQEYEVEKNVAYEDTLMFLDELLKINALVWDTDKG